MHDVHPRRLLAHPRQEGLFVPRAGLGGCRRIARGGQLRPVPDGDDRGNRAPDAARLPLALAARGGIRHGRGPALCQRPLGGRSPHRDDDGGGLAGVRSPAAEGPVQGRARRQRHLRSAAAGASGLAQRRPAA